MGRWAGGGQIRRPRSSWCPSSERKAWKACGATPNASATRLEMNLGSFPSRSRPVSAGRVASRENKKAAVAWLRLYVSLIGGTLENRTHASVCMAKAVSGPARGTLPISPVSLGDVPPPAHQHHPDERAAGPKHLEAGRPHQGLDPGDRMNKGAKRVSCPPAPLVLPPRVARTYQRSCGKLKT